MLETIAKHFAWPDLDALMYFVRSRHQWRTRAEGVMKKKTKKNVRQPETDAARNLWGASARGSDAGIDQAIRS
jgi:hypothetical protein